MPSFDSVPWEHKYEEDQQEPWDEDDEEQMDALHHDEMRPEQVSSPEGPVWDQGYEEERQNTQH
jgi:hypothetical protein